MAEFGIVTRVGLPQIKELLAVIADRDDHRLPPGARACLESLGRQFLSLHEEICRQAPPCLAPIEPREPAPCNHTRHRTGYGERAGRLHRRSFSVQVGPRAGGLDRACAAQNSTGGKQRLGKISKQGDQYLRWLLVAGAMAVIRHARRRGATNQPWLDDLIARRPTKVAAVH